MRSIDMINEYINPPAKNQENNNDLAAVAEKLNDIANTLDAVNLKLEKQQKAAKVAKDETKKETKNETKKESEAVDNGNTEHNTDAD